MGELVFLGLVYCQNGSNRREYLIPRPASGRYGLFGGAVLPGDMPKLFLKEDVMKRTGLEVFVEDILGRIDEADNKIYIQRCRTLSNDAPEGFEWVGSEEISRYLKENLPKVPSEMSIYLEKFG